MATKLAAADKRAIERALRITMKLGQDCDVTNRSFPHQRNKPGKPRPTSTESPEAILPTVKEATSFPTMQNAKRGAKQVRGKGEN